MYKTISLAIVIFATIALASVAQASIMYSTVGGTYSQSFDTLPSSPENTSLGSTPIGWLDDSASPGANQFSIVGWYLYHPVSQTEGGAANHSRMRIGAGTATTGAFMSFGASGSSERALGMVNSNTMSATAGTDFAFYGARFTNNTGGILTDFTLAYNGEQWRDGGNNPAVAQSLTFGYKVTSGAALLQDSGFTAVPTLDFTSPVFTNTGSGAAVVGNVAGKVPKGPVTVSGITWLPGDDLWIRWADLNDAGNDHGLAIDDVSFSAIAPEPTSLMLVCLAILGLVGVRRAR